MQVEALLCDAATVRENLLHVLGGGVTRIYRQFPATLGLDLALVLTLAPSEAHEKHRLRVLVQTADGAKLAEVIAEITVTLSPDLKPGERLTVPFALPLKQVPIPTEGTYGIDILVGGLLQRSFTFVAAPVPTTPS